MTDRYVIAGGAGLANGTSWENAYVTIGAAISAAVTNVDTIYVQGGTFTEHLVNTKNLTFICPSDRGTGEVLLDLTSNANHGVNTTGSITFYGKLKIINVATAGRYSFVSTNATQMIDSLELDTNIQGVRNTATVTGVVRIKKFIVKNITSGSLLFVDSTGAVTTDIDCAFIENCKYIYLSNTNASTTLHIGQALFSGMSDNIIYTTSGFVGAAVIDNSIGIAIPHDLSTKNIINKNGAAGTVTFNNSCLLPHPTNPTYTTTGGGGADGTNNIYGLPGFTSFRRDVTVSVCIDDYVNIDQFEAIAAECDARGMKCCSAIDHTNTVTPTDWARYKVLTDAGHEVLNHTRHETNWGTLNAFSIVYAGASTLTIDVAGDSLTTTGANPLNYTLSSYANVAALVAALNAETGYTVTVSGDGTLSGNGLTSSLSDVTGQDISSAYIAIYDAATHFAEEVTGGKNDIEAGIPGYTVNSFVYCGGYNDVSLFYLFEGYSGARAVASNGSYTLTSYEIMHGWSIRATDIAPTALTTAQKTQRVAALLEWAGWLGVPVNIYGHPAAEYSVADWRIVLDAIAASNARKMTLTEQYEDIRANGTASGAGTNLTYSRSFDDVWTPSLAETSDLVTTGKKWWSGVGPVGLNDEPVSEIDADIGPYPTTYGPFHPVNL